MNTQDLQKLKKLAERATPGQWVSEHHQVSTENGSAIAHVACTRGKYELEHANRDYIAAANPAAILELIAIAERTSSAGSAVVMSEQKLDDIARSYFAEDWAQKKLKDAINEALRDVGALQTDHRKTLEQIAGWMNSSARIVQNGPDDFGYPTEFDYQLAQAASEITAILAAASPVAVEEAVAWRVGEFWSSSNPFEKVLMLASDERTVKLWQHRMDFIRWVSPSAAAAQPAPTTAQQPIYQVASRDRQVWNDVSRFVYDTFEDRSRVRVLYAAAQAPAQTAAVQADTKDATRLDYVLDCRAFICTLDEGMHQLMKESDDGLFDVISGEGEAFRTRREAIDAAMEIDAAMSSEGGANADQA